jgi:hypothetical protein
MLYLVQKIPNFCMSLGWGIMNNVLYCANIQLSIELELKILEQIQSLMNFKRDLNLLEKSAKFFKIPS